jgi:twinkle protein
MDAIEFAVYKDDVQHIIIDNLQFMMPRSSSGASSVKGGFEKFDIQDQIIDRLRKYATEKNV